MLLSTTDDTRLVWILAIFAGLVGNYLIEELIELGKEVIQAFFHLFNSVIMALFAGYAQQKKEEPKKEVKETPTPTETPTPVAVEKPVANTEFLSQVDPDYKKFPLGTSSYTIGSAGCFYISVLNLYGVSEQDFTSKYNDIFKTKAFTPDGLLLANVIAQEFGGTYTGKSSQPSNTACIGMTHDNRKYGIETHFFVCFPDGTQIDPIDYPAKRRDAKYTVAEYRHFTNVKI